MFKLKVDGKMSNISYCNGCGCMTYSIKKGRATLVCGKCGYDKSFGNVMQNKLKHQRNDNGD